MVSSGGGLTAFVVRTSLYEDFQMGKELLRSAYVMQAADVLVPFRVSESCTSRRRVNTAPPQCERKLGWV